MRVAIGADHAGVQVKEAVKHFLSTLAIPCEDFGTDSADSVDYPDVAELVGRKVAAGIFDFGVLVCGSGIGMGIAANKIPGVRAAPAWDVESARLSRAHNNANVLTIGARLIPSDRVLEIVRTFILTPFDGGRHQRRLDKIARLDEARALLRKDEGGVMTNESGQVAKMHRSLREIDPEVAQAIHDETRRQIGGLELIASENFVSSAVLEAAGSIFTNKYAEGTRPAVLRGV